MTYEINKSEIIQKFCENRDKPELKCEGTCHMKKMMVDEGSDAEQSPKTVIPEIQLYFSQDIIELMSIENQLDYQIRHKELYTFNFLNDLEIPPEA